MAYIVLALAVIGGLILASTFVFDVNDRVLTVGWLACLASLTLLVIVAVVAARRGGDTHRGSLRHGARQAWEWLKAFTP